jgi:outer membrane protein assembly factor BamB
MRHMKRRSLAALLLAGLLALGLLACTPSSGSRGWAAPVRTEDTLLVSTGKGRLDALDGATRDPLWRFPNRWNIPDSKARGLKGIYSTPVFSSDRSTIFVGDYNGYLYAFRPGDLDQTNTTIKPNAASLKLNGPVIGGIAHDPSTNMLFVTSGQQLFSVSAADMMRKIENRDATVAFNAIFDTDGEIWSTPVVEGNRVFFASLDGNLYAINKSTGAEEWRYTGARSLVSTPVVAGNTLLVGGFDDRLHAVDMSTGNQRWEFEAENWIWSAPLVDGNRVYVGDFDGRVHALNLSDGSTIWSATIAESPIVASPALAQGVLVVASQSGEIFGIDPANQAKKWGPSELGTSLTADLVAGAQTVYIAPSGCVTPPGESTRTYFVSVDPLNGSLVSTSEVC